MALRFNKLSGSNLRTLKSGQSVMEHGLVAKRLPNGDLIWRINVMVDGQRIHRAVGKESEGVTRTQAEEYLEKIKSDARVDRLNLPQGRKLHRTFADAVEDYLKRMEETGGRDLKNKTRNLRQHLVPFLGKDRLDKITEFRLRQYRKHRLDQGASHATINRDMAAFSHLMHRAASKAWRWIKPEDMPEIPKEREARKKITILSQDDRDSLLKAAKQDTDPKAWLFVMFGLNACMRHSEIVARRYDEIDFANCRIWINRAKAGEREQPITPALRDALKAQQALEDDKNGWIFPSLREPSKHPYRRDMRIAFARIVKAAGLNPSICTPHVMRHTGITQLVKAKTDIPTIQKISGHKTVAMVMHYIHVYGEHIDDAISALDTGSSNPVTHELHMPENDVDSNSDQIPEKASQVQ
ncbi:tyrosine-type recombinase/integrase [Sphingomonas sp. C8-2]|nr:tyrosine-type recombinase/integrase [Sphingomonas sp. C8-2]